MSRGARKRFILRLKSGDRPANYTTVTVCKSRPETVTFGTLYRPDNTSTLRAIQAVACPRTLGASEGQDISITAVADTREGPDRFAMVFVDDLIHHGAKGLWCHLWCDGSTEELHAFAASIGLQRAWFQDQVDHPHYDLRPAKRRRAIARGAKAVTCLELVGLIRKAREQRAQRAAPC